MEQSTSYAMSIPEVSALFEQACSEVRAAGVGLSDRDIIWLYELSVKQILPTLSNVDPYISPPARLGDLYLWPLTIQAEMWLEDFAFDWWERDSLILVLATCWAMANSGPDTQAGFFRWYTMQAYTWLTIKQWGKKNLPYPKSTLEWLVGKLLNRQKTIQVDNPGLISAIEYTPSSLEWGPFIASVCRAGHNLKPEDVLRMNSKQCLSVLRSGKLAEGEGQISEKDLNDNLIRTAFEEFRLAIRHLILKGAKNV